MPQLPRAAETPREYLAAGRDSERVRRAACHACDGEAEEAAEHGGHRDRLAVLDAHLALGVPPPRVHVAALAHRQRVPRPAAHIGEAHPAQLVKHARHRLVAVAVAVAERWFMTRQTRSSPVYRQVGAFE